MTMDPALLVSGLLIFASFFVGAITAYGSSLIALPMLVWAISDIHTAVLVVLVLGVVQSYHIAIYTYRDTDWRALRRMLAWAGVGLPIGYLSMEVLPQGPLLVTLGVVAAASGLSRLVMGAPEKANRPSAGVMNVLLFAGGVIHGAFICGGATVVIYAQHMLAKKETFRATLCMFWLVLNTVLITGNIVQRNITWEASRFALAGLPFLLLGNWLGELVARRMQQRRFVQSVAVLLVVAGVTVIVRGVRP